MPAYHKVNLQGETRRIAPEHLDTFQQNDRRYLERQHRHDRRRPEIAAVIRVFDIAAIAANGDRFYRLVGEEPIPVP